MEVERHDLEWTLPSPKLEQNPKADEAGIFFLNFQICSYELLNIMQSSRSRCIILRRMRTLRLEANFPVNTTNQIPWPHCQVAPTTPTPGSENLEDRMPLISFHLTSSHKNMCVNRGC